MYFPDNKYIEASGILVHGVSCDLCVMWLQPFSPFFSFADEREAVQKKTFTKWVNSHLGRVTCRIGDLYTDLRDGRMLIRLLEVLSGEQLVSITQKPPFFAQTLTQTLYIDLTQHQMWGWRRNHVLHFFSFSVIYFSFNLCCFFQFLPTFLFHTRYDSIVEQCQPSFSFFCYASTAKAH